jgi:D-glycero-alpha-D-manno-heptose-7-phosphate kinase
MIIARSPLRVTFGGGGTDLPSYCLKHGGFLVAAAIDKYVYVSIHRTFLKQMVIRYSKIESVQEIEEIHHPIVREALRLAEIRDINLEITSMADIPAGTGLGSSGSFTTALLKALYSFQRKTVQPRDLAELASHIEIDLLQEPIGKQDQYIAAIGGITAFEFHQDGTVDIRPLALSQRTLELLEDNLVLFATGTMRAASEILQVQDQRSKQDDPAMIDNLHLIKDLGYRSCRALESGDLAQFGRLMDEHWREKKKRAEKMSSSDIDRWYNHAMDNGALGGKLIGAGGGGFLMFYSEEPERLRNAMSKLGLFELRFSFDFQGCRLLL